METCTTATEQSDRPTDARKLRRSETVAAMENWKEQVIELHGHSTMPEHCGSGWTAWQLEAARDELICRHADPIATLLRRQGGDVQAFRRWVADVEQQAALYRAEGRQAHYTPSPVPTLIVECLQADQHQAG